MTPAATTPAARGRGAPAGHRRSLAWTPAPRAPRRVSGPAPGRRPQAHSHAPSTRRRPAAWIGSLPDHRLLDRIVRGRAWIPLLGVMLAGIVAMQVEQLKLGASIGRSIQRSSALQSRNELLRTNVAALADDQRIKRLAAGMGMIMPAPEAIGFVSATPGGDAGRAVANVHVPDSAGFLSLASSNGAVVTGAGASDANGSAAALAPASASGSTQATGG